MFWPVFWSRFLGGSAGYLELTLFVLGLICVALEIFVLPGFGVFGVSGGVLIFSGLILASQTWGEFGFTFDPTSASRTLGPFCRIDCDRDCVCAFYEPISPANESFRPHGARPAWRNIRTGQRRADLAARLLGEKSAWVDANSLVGKRGTSISTLRPAGKAEIDGRYLDVVSNGPYIDNGVEIEVVAQSGNRIVVKIV